MIHVPRTNQLQKTHEKDQRMHELYVCNFIAPTCFVHSCDHLQGGENDLLHSGHRHVSSTDVTIFRVVRTIYCIVVKDMFHPLM